MYCTCKFNTRFCTIQTTSTMESEPSPTLCLNYGYTGTVCPIPWKWKKVESRPSSKLEFNNALKTLAETQTVNIRTDSLSIFICAPDSILGFLFHRSLVNYAVKYINYWVLHLNHHHFQFHIILYNYYVDSIQYNLLSATLTVNWT